MCTVRMRPTCQLLLRPPLLPDSWANWPRDCGAQTDWDDGGAWPRHDGGNGFPLPHDGLPRGSSGMASGTLLWPDPCASDGDGAGGTSRAM